MRYRQQTLDGDYTFGVGGSNFYVDSPQAVAQAVQTRLKLAQGEWFLDNTLGTPYQSQILGSGTLGSYDAAIQKVILETSGVTSIADYASGIDPSTRAVVVACTINTKYGTVPLIIPAGGF